ncbi:Sec63-domain-containing protein [Metschnikowia bicuspidata]|uniref:Sec63-domain-containing protein n=1 Tax=Metschnikowia bicuspidata TaxID=27322 RepID=A0A4P9ZFL6_9ASCO|nr:Sec63-domain-containing protein [Metschnikowia bicuspidata]
MAQYSANSTASYMQAMAPMVDILSKWSPAERAVFPSVDCEREMCLDLDRLLAPFADVYPPQNEKSARDEGASRSESLLVRQIQAGCARISAERGQPENEVYALVQTAVAVQNSEQEVQSHLFDILGAEKFELIALVLQNRALLLSQQSTQETANAQLFTPKEQVARLFVNRERRKHEKLAPSGALRRTNTQYPHVFKQPEASNVVAITGKQYVLPQGTTRTSYATHEEIVIPYFANDSSQYISETQLVRVAKLDRLCRGTLKYATLNKMQSLVYPVAYTTNENMLVCAPTGSGKTDVALLTILHTIRQYMRENDDAVEIDCDQFKIVYVAPLKALAAEIVDKYAKKLRWLGIRVCELTGDMQLTRAEIMATQVIVTTPEKWDVITRKQSGDNDLVAKVKLLVIDEVHLLHEERGSVIETLVARTLRQVESTQLMIRVVGLSATLPNYMDVADFLGVNRSVGMFYFDQLFRPCPLRQELVGVRGKTGSKTARENIDRVCYDKVVASLREGRQVMVFVHSRRDTAKTAWAFVSMAQASGHTELFAVEGCAHYETFRRNAAGRRRGCELRELFPHGLGVHHAGMFRADRRLTEQMFLAGAIRVLCCTATLAWGVNLPAAVVVVKGTLVYDARQGGYVDLGISDVLQIFGRAGRPQFEAFGTGVLCTALDRLDHYVSLLAQQHPIESRLVAKLTDNLNAEVALGTVTSVDEGVQWLGYTYMYVRMRQNPLSYGVAWRELQADLQLVARRHAMVENAARRLHALQMVVFDENTGALLAKDLGRVASAFYVLYTSVEIFNAMAHPRASAADALAMVCMSSEFDNVKCRDEESKELLALADSAPYEVAAERDSAAWKSNVLLQAHVLQRAVTDLALVADCHYVAQNAARICRALFLVAVDRCWGHFAKVMLLLCKALDRRVWMFDHPLAQFNLPPAVLRNVRASACDMDALRDMLARELGDVAHNAGAGRILHRLVHRVPHVVISAQVFPVTAQVVRMRGVFEPHFAWDDQFHGRVQHFWVFVEDADDTHILHVEKLVLRRARMSEPHQIEFMLPLSSPPPAQLVVRFLLDAWLGAESAHAAPLQHFVAPHNASVLTRLLRLQPLPVTALRDATLEALYRPHFRYFNPMQTMVFHTLYHSSTNVFIGAPTGSGKTVVAELAMWRALRELQNGKVVYIAPMKALVRERVDDWRRRICAHTGRTLVELTGDSTPDARAVREASIVVTTPEKFDGISRSWQTRQFVQHVSLVIMDEIHLLASDRGPILEMIVSRMNYMAEHTQRPVRLLGMSTQVSNACDMAGWLRVRDGLFNFASSVRPVPLRMYIDGFPDNLAFCPLMKTMNRPAFMAIKQHLPHKPVLIFVASRRQTRLTALDLIHLCGSELDPRRFLRMDDAALEDVLARVRDDTLRMLLQFGIGVHHAGLVDTDRQLAHSLFEQGRIQILVATSTLAWGVNLPAHLVIVKGTQFFDLKIDDYRDMDLTDILQMMGRAGRPAFDTSGTAIVYTREAKKTFYKHFLNVGFPVESSLHKVLDDHLGAEIAAGTVKTRQQAMEFLAWTFLYRRAHHNPMYYGIEDASDAGVGAYLAGLIDAAVASLAESQCVRIGPSDALCATPYLRIASFYYVSHKTIRSALQRASSETDFRECLQTLCLAAEYDELATRHGEDLVNTEMSRVMRYPADDMGCDEVWDPHVKAYLLLQAYMDRVELSIADYVQDTLSVLNQALRILQALTDVAAEMGYLRVVLNYIQIMQCLKQRLWPDVDPLFALADGPVPAGGPTLAELGAMDASARANTARRLFPDADRRHTFLRAATCLPTGDLAVVQREPTCLLVELRRHNEPQKNFRVHAPHFPKPQKESWFVVLCDARETELLSMRRVSPEEPKGHVLYHFEVADALCGRDIVVACFSDAMALSYKTTFTLMS